MDHRLNTPCCTILYPGCDAEALRDSLDLSPSWQSGQQVTAAALPTQYSLGSYKLKCLVSTKGTLQEHPFPGPELWVNDIQCCSVESSAMPAAYRTQLFLESTVGRDTLPSFLGDQWG